MKPEPTHIEPHGVAAEDSSSFFATVLATLGIQASDLPTGPQSTSATDHILTNDAGTSWLKPFSITFQDTAHRDAYLKLAGIDPASRPDFPLAIIAFAANDLTITTGNPLLIEAASGLTPVAINMDKLTLQTGAQISCCSSLVATVQTLTKQ
jgi:hypothetical protein